METPSAGLEDLKPPEVKDDLEEVQPSSKDMTREVQEIQEVVKKNGDSEVTEEVKEEKADPAVEDEEEAPAISNGSEKMPNGDTSERVEVNGEGDEIKKEEEVTCEEKVNGEMHTEGDVKEESDAPDAMDTSREPDPTPEPPEPPEDKGPRLEKCIFEEDLVDGFSFCSFETYPVVVVRITHHFIILVELIQIRMVMLSEGLA